MESNRPGIVFFLDLVFFVGDLEWSSLSSCSILRRNASFSDSKSFILSAESGAGSSCTRGCQL